MTLKNFLCLVCIVILTFELIKTVMQQIKVDEKSLISNLPRIYF